MNANQEEPSFEELLRESEQKTVHSARLGQKYPGTVVQINGDVIYIDIGMRSEVILRVSDDPRIQEIKQDDDVEVFVKTNRPVVEVALDPILGFGDFSVVESAFDGRKPVSGKVESLGRGGYTVNIAGVQCFCPISQIDARYVEEPARLVGETFDFRVIELDRDKSDVVISRRALLEEKRKLLMEETRKKIVEGAVLGGTVVDIRNFGAFVDLGGIHGLVHISELAHHKVNKVDDVLSVGQETDVKVLSIARDDKGKERISLSLKALLPNPWDTLELEPGQIVEGTIVRITNFGIFINLKPAIDGLIPLRYLKRSGRNMDLEDFQRGQTVEVEVTEVDHRDRKITLCLPGWDEEMKSSLQPGERLKVSVVKVIPVGIIVQGVEDPARGLIHKSTLKDGSVKQLVKAYPEGTELEVILESIDEQGRFNFTFESGKEVDGETMGKFGGEGNAINHNPFAAFYSKE